MWSCLLLPALSLDVYARAQSPAEAAKPFAVTTGGRVPRIESANATACNAGIRAGQLVSASLALSPDLVLRERDPTAEAAALAAVATWVTQFTPAVTLASPDAVLAEIGSSLRLFGGLTKLTARLCDDVQQLGYATRFALAATPAAALFCARARIGERTAPRSKKGAPQKELASLPLSLTEADPAAVATLAAAGIATFGQACALPRAALARRVGADFVALLDRVRGYVPDPRVPFVPAPRYLGKIELPVPVDSIEALVFAVNRLVHELTGWLSGRGQGVIEMSLTLAHERHTGAKTGVPATFVDVRLAAPTREPSHLITVLRERLARVALPATVETLALASKLTVPLAGRNLDFFPGDDSVPTVPLLDRLRARLGDDAVKLVAPHAEHRPERAWRESNEDMARQDSFSAGKSLRRASKKIAADPTFDPACASPRPLWLCAEPEPLGHRLETQPWVLRDGPERIESGWWDGTDVRRDYFVAENPRGETVWIYRDHRYGIDDGEWFLHGLFA
jgi:protein ImuB